MPDKKKQQPSIEERVALLRAKMGQMDLGGDKGYWAAKEGRNIIRILPAAGLMPFFFQEVGVHYNLPDGASEKCPSFTSGGEEDCPICQLVTELYRAGKSYKGLANKLRVRKQFWMNVIVRDVGDQKGNTGTGPLIYTPGVSVFRSIQTLVSDPDYGDISDVETGVDLNIDRRGQGLDTEYEVQTRKYSFAASSDPDQLAEWLEFAKDLTPAFLTDSQEEDAEVKGDAVVAVLPYERLLAKHGLGPGADVSDMQVDEEASVPARASNRRREASAAPTRASTKVPKPAVDAENGEEEDSKVGASIRMRIAQRGERPF